MKKKKKYPTRSHKRYCDFSKFPEFMLQLYILYYEAVRYAHSLPSASALKGILQGCSLRSQPHFGLRPRLCVCSVARLLASLTALLRPSASVLCVLLRGCSLRSQPYFGLRPQIHLILIPKASQFIKMDNFVPLFLINHFLAGV